MTPPTTSFDEDYLRIEANQRANEPVAKFEPYGQQIDFLRDQTSRIVFVRGGNRSGKTEIVALNAAAHFLDQHPFYQWNRPITIWVIVPRNEQIGEYMWPKIKKYIPEKYIDMDRISWLKRTSPEIPLDIPGKNGSRISFKSADSRLDKFAGAQVDLAIIDEEVDQSRADEIHTRLLDTGGRLIVAFSPVQGYKWLSQWERDFDVPVYRLRMSENPHIDQEAVAAYLATKSERVRRIRDLGEYASAEGLVYPNFDRDLHVIRKTGDVYTNAMGEEICPWPVPKHWYRYAAIDFGYSHPTAVVQCAQSPEDETIIIERVAYASHIRISRWAGLIKNIMPALRQPYVADWDRMEREELRARGVDTVAANKDIVLGIEQVETLFETGNVYMVEDESLRNDIIGRYDCQALVNELENYCYPEQKEGLKNEARDMPLKKNDHACDALRYLAMYLKPRCAPLPPPSFEPVVARGSSGSNKLWPDMANPFE